MPDNNYSFTIADTHPCFAGHFADNPVLPGAVILEQVLLKWDLFSKKKILSIDFAKFMQPVLPDVQCFIFFNPVKSKKISRLDKTEFIVKSLINSDEEKGEEIILCKGRLVYD